MAKTPEPQAAIIVRLLNGTATKQDADTADANYQRWIREEWNGDQNFSLAWCTTALRQAYGNEGRTFAQDDWVAHIWLFNFMCIPKDDIDSEAHGYRSGVLAQGGFHETAKRIKWINGMPQ